MKRLLLPTKAFIRSSKNLSRKNAEAVEELRETKPVRQPMASGLSKFQPRVEVTIAAGESWVR